jgi:hypothetical protein
MHGLMPLWIWLRICEENRKFADFRHSNVNDTTMTKNDLWLTPIYFVKVIGIVQDNLPMCVFSIDIPFKGSQSRVVAK